jgi:putative ABC transport system ATP-binding protein
VDAQNVSRVFSMPAGPVTAVRDVTLHIRNGDHIAVRGPSGCGKSTLLHMLGCVEPQTSGTLLFDGQDVSQLSDARRSLLRLKQIGFVFQRFFLLPMLTARENVELPMAEAGVARTERRDRARELLAYVGLAHRVDHRATQLSGGEMQRVAIARALAKDPQLIFADEPTSALDGENGQVVIKLLHRAAKQHGAAVICVTHDPRLETYADRIIHLEDGRILDDRRTEHAANISIPRQPALTGA